MVLPLRGEEAQCASSSSSSSHDANDVPSEESMDADSLQITSGLLGEHGYARGGGQYLSDYDFADMALGYEEETFDKPTEDVLVELDGTPKRDTAGTFSDSPPVVTNENHANLNHRTERLGHGLDEADLPDFMVKQEFDPTSEEGQLYLLSALEFHAELVGKQQNMYAVDDTTLALNRNDTRESEELINGMIDSFMKDCDGFEGMREYRVAVLGSGDLLGIDLTRFEDFEEISLADVNIYNTQLALGDDRYTTLHGKASLHREDISGILPAFRWKTEHIYGVVDTPEEAYQYLSQYIRSETFLPDHLRYDTGFNSSMRYIPHSDIIVVNQLFHEVGYGFVKHLQSEMVRLKNRAWGTTATEVFMGLSDAAGVLQEKVEERVFDELVRKMALNKNRKCLIFISLQRETEWTESEDGTRSDPIITRTADGDSRFVKRFAALGDEVSTGREESMVVRRWVEDGVQKIREVCEKRDEVFNLKSTLGFP